MPLLDHFRPPLSRTHPWRGPPVPLWFAGAEAAVPPDLDASHTAACSDLTIRQAG